ncbi:MAG: chloride channel protein, partial [Abditibacteriaceae bacterium]
AFVGFIGVKSTQLVFWFEEMYEKLPIHWMWWPAIGGLAVGVIGYFAPHTLGVGYDNVTNLLNAETVGVAALILGLAKLLSWSVSVSSGTAGGTMAPLFTIGAGVGSFVGALALMMWPHSHIDVRLAALVGMAAMFTSSYQVFLASVVLAFETTQQPAGLLPLIGGCALAYFISCYILRGSLITDKFAKMGVRVPVEQTADFLQRITAGEIARSHITVLRASESAARVRRTIDDEALRQGLAVENENGHLVGLLTARDFIAIDDDSTETIGELVHRPLAIVFEDSNMREAADHMVREKVGRLPVVERENPDRVVGIITREDVLSAHKLRLDNLNKQERLMHPRQKARKIWKDITSRD